MPTTQEQLDQLARIERHLGERVDRGAAVLTERVPDWYLRVNVNRLDAGDVSGYCPLSQVAALVTGFTPGDVSFGNAAEVFGQERKGYSITPKSQRWLEDHGFDLGDRSPRAAELSHLTAIWLRKITELRGGHKIDGSASVTDLLGDQS